MSALQDFNNFDIFIWYFLTSNKYTSIQFKSMYKYYTDFCLLNNTDPTQFRIIATNLSRTTVLIHNRNCDCWSTLFTAQHDVSKFTNIAINGVQILSPHIFFIFYFYFIFVSINEYKDIT